MSHTDHNWYYPMLSVTMYLWYLLSLTTDIIVINHHVYCLMSQTDKSGDCPVSLITMYIVMSTVSVSLIAVYSVQCLWQQQILSFVFILYVYSPKLLTRIDVVPCDWSLCIQSNVSDNNGYHFTSLITDCDVQNHWQQWVWTHVFDQYVCSLMSQTNVDVDLCFWSMYILSNVPDNCGHWHVFDQCIYCLRTQTTVDIDKFLFNVYTV